MATNNVLNANVAGFQSYDGAFTFNGRTLTAGTGVNITDGDGVAGDPVISATGGGLDWIVKAANDDLVASTGFFANGGGALTFTLPATSAVGDTFGAVDMSGNGFVIAQNAGQTVHLNGSSTTTGAGGSLTSSTVNASLFLVCNIANTDFIAVSSVGSFAVA